MGWALSWIMRAIPVRWWSVLIVVVASAYWFRGEILGTLTHWLIQQTTPASHQERIDCFVDLGIQPSTTDCATAVTREGY